MSSEGNRPNLPIRAVRRTPVAGRSAVGQVLALVIVLLVALPLLPLILLIIGWIRLLDRYQADRNG